MGDIDTDVFNGIGTKGLSAKKKAYLERIELREAKKKAIEIDKKILIRDDARNEARRLQVLETQAKLDKKIND